MVCVRVECETVGLMEGRVYKLIVSLQEKRHDDWIEHFCLYILLTRRSTYFLFLQSLGTYVRPCGLVSPFPR